MKKLATTTLLMLIVVFGFTQTETKDYSLSRSGKKLQGVYIFVLTEPFYNYKHVATIDVKLDWGKILDEDFENVIKKAKKKHPYFNGMIFHNSDLNKVDLNQRV